MVKEPKPRRGMPRSLIYALIPAGFIVMVVVMVLGSWTGQTEVEPEPAPDTSEAAAPE